MKSHDIDYVVRGAKEILENMRKAIIGYDEEIKYILISLLANGHVLLEGVPGVAKTTMARSLTRLLGLDETEIVEINGVPYKGFSRIQFTPDLMPSDIIGSLIYNPKTLDFEPRLGPIFAYIVLADEINRATPRTQSAMLQAMQEREVTIGGKTYPLEDRARNKFFFVLATQNPIEQEGTYPLPEAQLDRFLMRIITRYPESLEEEKEILRLHSRRLGEPLEELEPVVEPEWVVKSQKIVAEKIVVPEDMLDYTARLVRATRPEIMEPVSKYFELGLSPRAGIALMKAAKAHAAVRGADIVEPVDVNAVFYSVANHRVIPNMETIIEYGGSASARMRVIKEGLEFVLKNTLG